MRERREGSGIRTRRSDRSIELQEGSYVPNETWSTGTGQRTGSALPLARRSSVHISTGDGPGSASTRSTEANGTEETTTFRSNGDRNNISTNGKTLTYGKHSAHRYNWPTTALMRIITLVRKWPMSPGELYDDGYGHWVLSCPNCGKVALLDHEVTMLMDAITITPSVECPYDCGFHEVITGWQLKEVDAD